MQKAKLLQDSSRGEIEIYLHLSKLDLDFNQEKIFKDLLSKKGHPLRFDFYIPEYNLCIEFQGKQHYEFVTDFFSTKEEFEYYLENDRNKVSYCREKNINLLTIKYTKFSSIKSIIDNKLFKIEKVKGFEGLFNKKTKAQSKKIKEDFKAKRYIKRLRTKFKTLIYIEDLKTLENELINYRRDLHGQAKGACTCLIKDVDKKIKKVFSESFSEKEKTIFKEQKKQESEDSKLKEIDIQSTTIEKKPAKKKKESKYTKEGKLKIKITPPKPQTYYDNLEFYR